MGARVQLVSAGGVTQPTDSHSGSWESLQSSSFSSAQSSCSGGHCKHFRLLGGVPVRAVYHHSSRSAGKSAGQPLKRLRECMEMDSYWRDWLRMPSWAALCVTVCYACTLLPQEIVLYWTKNRQIYPHASSFLLTELLFSQGLFSWGSMSFLPDI